MDSPPYRYLPPCNRRNLPLNTTNLACKGSYLLYGRVCYPPRPRKGAISLNLFLFRISWFISPLHTYLNRKEGGNHPLIAISPYILLIWLLMVHIFLYLRLIFLRLIPHISPSWGVLGLDFLRVFHVWEDISFYLYLIFNKRGPSFAPFVCS